MECKKCNVELPLENFSISRTYGQTVYRHKTCRACRRTGTAGFEPRLSEDEIKRMIEHEPDFGVLSGKDFYDTVQLSINTQQFYRYVRDGSIKKFYEKHSK